MPVEKIPAAEKDFYQYLRTNAKDVLEEIKNTKELSESTENKLKHAIEQFVKSVK